MYAIFVLHIISHTPLFKTYKCSLQAFRARTQRIGEAITIFSFKLSRCTLKNTFYAPNKTDPRVIYFKLKIVYLAKSRKIIYIYQNMESYLAKCKNQIF